MKKILFIASIFIVVFILLLIYSLLTKSKRTEVIEPQIIPTPTIKIPQGDTINISGVPLNNFYKEAERIDNQGDVLFADVPNKYQILYMGKFDMFAISIVGAPFEETREEAEKALLIKTGLSQAEACKLNIEITTPSFANPDYAGKTYPLSFCQ